MAFNSETRRVVAAALVAATAITVGGCSFGPSGEAMQMAANEPPVQEPVYEDEAPSEAEIQAALNEAADDSFGDNGTWVCSYDATMNYDWHDDVLCTNGHDFDRPYLRSWDDYVTESELMASAAEYEDELNGNQ